MSKEFCEESIDCLVYFSNCCLNLCVWNKLSTTISIYGKKEDNLHLRGFESIRYAYMLNQKRLG